MPRGQKKKVFYAQGLQPETGPRPVQLLITLQTFVIQVYMIPVLSQSHIDELNYKTEGNSGVDVSFIEVLVKTFCNQHYAYHDQECKCQYL